MSTYLTTLPLFAASFLASLAALTVAVAIYTLVTPLREFALISAGNSAAAVSFGGALFGLAIPIGSAIAHSRDMVDLMVWSAVALVAQLVVYLAIEFAWRDATKRIAEGSHAHAIVLGVASVAVGVLNAACLTT